MDIDMKLKIGDKVKITKYGFKFHSNLDISFEMNSVCLSMKREHFTSAVCELFAINGVGTVKKFNDEGEPYVRWDFKLGGIKYHYSHYYELASVKKLSFLDRIIFKIKGLV
jgi:hypothetical protein